MTNPKFLKPENDVDLNPVDYWNLHHSWMDCFENIRDVEWLTTLSIANNKAKKECFIIQSDGMLMVTDENYLKLPVGKAYTKFMFLTRIKFKGNHRACSSYIESKYLHFNIPFIRVGTDYFKVIEKTDRYKVKRKIIKGWKKEEIKQDHGPSILKHIQCFDDFCIEPDNTNHELIIDSCYNLYAPFSHKPMKEKSDPSCFPVSWNLLNHIFGEQVDLGIKYLKLIYENPMQPLPILCLVSKERQTGKTTFLNWLQILFGDNFIQINPEDLNSQFNSIYATKNLIALDETVIDKSHAVEKLKSIATAKTISVNQKFVANYAIPFFGKVIICTNKEKDFMRIDEEEIRFWVRKVPTIKSINTKIEADLRSEIPAFLKFLVQLPSISTSKSRMVFTADELKNESLQAIQNESKSWLRKELFNFIQDFFVKNDGMMEFKASTMDIKSRWFASNHQITTAYLSKVIQDEMNLTPKRAVYESFDNGGLNKIRGYAFTFDRDSYITEWEENPIETEIPF